MTYRFWLETYNGQHISWSRLSKQEALAMHRATTKNTPENVKRFGWEHTA